ncbi:MAG: DUF4126 domain-containing protein [Terriglobales bacterium]
MASTRTTRRDNIPTMFHALSLPANEIAALFVAISFAAGLNVYATVATLGLLSHAHLLELPPGLHPVADWWVIGACIGLFAIEFVVDKIPVVDLMWNALHTFVRVPIAALLAYGATSQLSPPKQLLATLIGGAIALAAHSSKTALRALVTPSPEPFSNAALSFGEDAFAIGLTWFATAHPYSAAAIVLLFLTIIILLVRKIARAVGSMFRVMAGSMG